MSLSKTRVTPGEVIENAKHLNTLEEPVDASAFLRRGYAYYETEQFDKSIEDFKKAIDLEKNNVDAVFAMGMGLKAAGSKDEAIVAFNLVISLLDQGLVTEKTRARMLRRLALGHVNEISSGDWNLEEEIWHRVV